MTEKQMNSIHVERKITLYQIFMAIILLAGCVGTAFTVRAMAQDTKELAKENAKAVTKNCQEIAVLKANGKNVLILLSRIDETMKEVRQDLRRIERK